MKKAITIVLLLSLYLSYSSSLLAQSLELNTSFALNSLSGKSIQAATQSYNEVYGNQLKREMGSAGLPYLTDIGLRLWLTDNFGMCMNVSAARNVLKAEFNNGNIRQFTLLNRTPLDFGLVFGKKDKWVLQTRIGFATSALISNFEYPDGTVSFSQLQPLNGTYNTFGFFYKVDASIKIKGPLSVYAGIAGATNAGFYYNDLSGVRGEDGASDSWVPVNFAEYEKVLPGGNFYDYPEDAYWKMNYFMLFAGLQLNLTVYEK
jgi:hypothetical protein